MLRESLRLIAAGSVTGVSDLAERLGVTPSLAEQLVADLVRLGYLQSPEATCSSRCRGCPLAQGCSRQLGLFSITERGRQAASRGAA